MKVEESKTQTANQNSILDYTYHRHSEEKSNIYFRCSDKNCKARVIFSKETCKFTMKNKHLCPTVHKQNSKKAITGKQMAKIASLVKGPVSLSNIRTDDPLMYFSGTEDVNSDKEILRNEKEVCFLKITTDSKKTGKGLSEELAKSGLALSVEVLDLIGEGNRYPKIKVVEIESDLDNKNKILQIVYKQVGILLVETFRKI